MQVQTVTEQTEQMSNEAPAVTGRSLPSFADVDQSCESSTKPLILAKHNSTKLTWHRNKMDKDGMAKSGADVHELLGEDMTTNFQEQKANV